MKIRPRVFIYSIAVSCVILFLINLPKLLEDRHEVINETDIYREEINFIQKGIAISEKNKEFKKCIKLHKMALQTFNKHLPNEYTDIVRTMNNLAGAYLDDKQHSMATVMFLKAIEYAEANKVKDEHFAVLLNNISNCYKLIDNHKEALKWAERASPYYEMFYGAESEETEILKGNIEFLKDSIQ